MPDFWHACFERLQKNIILPALPGLPRHPTNLFVTADRERQDASRRVLPSINNQKSMELATELQKISYSLGVLMASSVRSQGADALDTDAVAAAFRDVFENNDLKISPQDANS